MTKVSRLNRRLVTTPELAAPGFDPRELIAQNLRPSRVITRNYQVSQHWALVIFRERLVRRWIGVSWWSFYESTWTSVAVWKPSALKLVDVQPLTLDHQAVRDAAQALRRPIHEM